MYFVQLRIALQPLLTDPHVAIEADSVLFILGTLQRLFNQGQNQAVIGRLTEEKLLGV
jgi:hypothetical protein